MQKLIITNINDITVSAVYDDMTMQSVRVPDEGSVIGNIYVGRVENIVKNIQAAFVEFNKGRKGYYSLTENTEHIFLNHKENNKLCQGDLILVQVSKDSVKTKEPTLTSQISLTGRFCVLSLNHKTDYCSVFASKKLEDEKKKRLQQAVKEAVRSAMYDIYREDAVSKSSGSVPVFDIIIRTNAENMPEEAVASEAVELVGKFADIMKYAPSRTAFTRMYAATDTLLEDVQNIRAVSLERIITDIPSVYETIRGYLAKNEPDELFKLELYNDELLPLASLYNMQKQIDSALKNRVWLSSGAYLVIEPTEALTVIDVNTGKFTGNRKLTDNTYLKINKEAAAEIARQLKLRNLSGIIIVDFINLNTREDERELMSYFEQLLSKDTVPTSLIDMTKLGLVEITRKKIRKPLHEILNTKTLNNQQV